MSHQGYPGNEVKPKNLVLDLLRDAGGDIKVSEVDTKVKERSVTLHLESGEELTFSGVTLEKAYLAAYSDLMAYDIIVNGPKGYFDVTNPLPPM
jgi:hypothetical protein